MFKKSFFYTFKKVFTFSLFYFLLLLFTKIPWKCNCPEETTGCEATVNDDVLALKGSGRHDGVEVSPQRTNRKNTSSGKRVPPRLRRGPHTRANMLKESFMTRQSCSSSDVTHFVCLLSGRFLKP